MPLHFVPEPPNGGSVIRDGLNKLAVRPNSLTQKGVDLSAIQFSQPHPVYDLRADAVAQGKGLESATLSGFRYLINDRSGSVVAAAEVQLDATGHASSLSHINDGPYVTSTAEAIANAGGLPQVAAGSFEIRVLRFSAVQVIALWLKSESGGADIVSPIAPTPDVLEPGHGYAPNEFLQALMPLVEKRVSRQDTRTVP